MGNHNHLRLGLQTLGIGAVTAGVIVAELVGAAAVPTAHADDVEDLLTQVSAALTQDSQVLDQIPTTELDETNASLLAFYKPLPSVMETGLNLAEKIQTGLPAVDQTNPLLLGVDQQWLQATDGLLHVDQDWLAAAHAGDLTGLTTSSLITDLEVYVAGIGETGASFDVSFVDLIAQLDPGLLAAF
jgi:hypothetical protein